MEIEDMQDTKLTIGTKSTDDVECILKERDYIVEVVKALCLARIENECESN